MTAILHWFRRDLRLYDNTALAAAARESGGEVIPVFVLDDTLLHANGRFTGAARVRFLLQSLAYLAEVLQARGSALVVRCGDPRHELPQLVRATGARAVFWNRDYSPYARRRDKAVAEALAAINVPVQQFKDAVIWDLDEIVTKAGTPYTVYTPYSRQWFHRTETEGVHCADVPQFNLPASVLPTSEPLPTLEELGLQTDQDVLPGGEHHAQALLQQFIDLRYTHNITHYGSQRDILALPATSRMSAHLRLGTISPRACVRAAQDAEATRRNSAQPDDRDQKNGVRAWIGELAWRDFYAQILAHFPHVLRGAFKQQYDALAWDNNDQLFAAWKAGQTGYPIVDAAMRQLQREAWMHNRARMIVASFLTKDLLIDWRRGERHFMQLLVDGDPASNNGGWQWVAGTGTDAQPYFRIFNPVSQGKQYDAAGAYVRTYVPELQNVPDAYIHEPWTMPAPLQEEIGVRIGKDYPAPIVTHAEQRQRALDMYGAVAGKQ
ncbi:MAG: deoxyribodipyrimidine photo-lyase [Chloroflexaceae bacterium]|nr:deoxyribodipyrimidine photo-lyase [Chloroflexaceae bacterium]NJL32851.1 deoxyribodipyrimidine photo-lyase [Chloroflexaceae bacterium]